MRRLFIVLLSSLLCLLGPVAAVDVYTTNGTLAFPHLYSPSVILNRPYFNLTGFVVAAQPINACANLTNANQVKGNIAWIVSGNCGGVFKIQNIFNAGAIGFIWADSGQDGGSGGVAYILQGEGIQYSTVPNTLNGVEYRRTIGDAVDLYFQAAVGNVTVTIYPDPNTFTPLQPAYILLSIVIGGLAVVYGVIASIKLYRFVTVKGPEVSVAQICLFLVIICALERILFSIDPAFAFGLYPYVISNLLLTGSVDLTLIAVMIISFYWEAAMRSSTVHGLPLLEKLKIPFAVVCVVLFVLEVVSAFLRGLYLDTVNFQGFIIVVLIIYIVIGLLIAVFYFIVGGRILYTLHRATSVAAKAKVGRANTRLWRMTLLIIISGVSLIVFVFGFIIFVGVAIRPAGVTCLSTWLFILGLSIVSLCQALIFDAPTTGDSSEGSDKPHTSQSSGTKGSMDKAQEDESSESEMEQA